jgi:ribosomal protein S18 acetylase RimI-like enzyme
VNDCTFREATTTDLEALSPLFAEASAFHAEALPGIFRQPEDPRCSQPFLLDQLANKETALLVADRDGEIVGLIHVTLRRAPDLPLFVPRRYASIESLVVREDCQRRGIGRRLVRDAERWARAKGAEEIELNVWEFNTGAVAFYERLGYATFSRRMGKALVAG